MTIEPTDYRVYYGPNFQPQHSSKKASCVHISPGMNFYALTKLLDTHPDVEYFYVYDQYASKYLDRGECPSGYKSKKWTKP